MDFDYIPPLMQDLLPEPDGAAVCIKRRLPPGSTEHVAWMEESLEYIRTHQVLAERFERCR